MKKATLKELKEDLHYWTTLANSGSLIIVTKYNEPFISMGPVLTNDLRMGENFGKAAVTSIGKSVTAGALFEFLDADRNSE